MSLRRLASALLLLALASLGVYALAGMLVAPNASPAVVAR